MAEKNWRMTRAEYLEWEKGFSQKGKHFDLWDAWSLRPHTEAEIMPMIIWGIMHDHNFLICFSYICSRSQLSEAFFDDVLYVTSNLFTFDAWNDKTVEFVVDLLRRKANENAFDEISDIAKGVYDVHPSLKLHAQRLVDGAIRNKLDDIMVARKHVEGGIKSMQMMLKAVQRYLKEDSDGLMVHFQMLDMLNNEVSAFTNKIQQYVVSKANVRDVTLVLESDFRFHFPNMVEWQKNVSMEWFEARRGKLHNMTAVDLNKRAMLESKGE